MKTVFFTTVENQLRDNGSYGQLYDHFYGAENQALTYDRTLAKFFTTCVTAFVSGIPYNETVLLNSSSSIREKQFVCLVY